MTGGMDGSGEPRATEPRMSSCVPGPDGSCSLCGDEAVEARVLAVDAATRTAAVAVQGAVRVAALDLVDDVVAGDLVMVHQGFAIARVGAA
jgi:hypothetical protein